MILLNRLAAVILLVCSLLVIGCSEKTPSATEGITPEQKEVYDAFGTFQDRIHSTAQMKPYLAKGYKPSSSVTKGLRKIANLVIFDAATDIQVSGNNATVKVRVIEKGAVDVDQETAPTKEWKMTKEGGKWKVSEITV